MNIAESFFLFLLWLEPMSEWLRQEHLLIFSVVYWNNKDVCWNCSCSSMTWAESLLYWITVFKYCKNTPSIFWPLSIICNINISSIISLNPNDQQSNLSSTDLQHLSLSMVSIFPPWWISSYQCDIAEHWVGKRWAVNTILQYFHHSGTIDINAL